MTNFNLVVLYVKDSAASAAFYEKLLGQPIAQSSPKFSMLPLSGGGMLGLWQREDVEPRAGGDRCLIPDLAARSGVEGEDTRRGDAVDLAVGDRHAVWPVVRGVVLMRPDRFSG